MKLNLLKQLMFVSRQIFYIFIVQLLAMQLLFANDTAGQNLNKISVTVEFENATLMEIINQLERKTGFEFAYDDFVLENSKQLSGSYKKESLHSILEDLSQNAGVKFQQINNTISVAKQTTKPTVRIAVPQQKKKLTGKVADAETGEPLIGVSVVIAGTTVGTATDIDGNFNLEVEADAQELSFSFIGYSVQTIEIGDQTNFTVELRADMQSVDEVVVTALGISRQKKALGYAVQEVGDGELSKPGESNFINSLSGKVAGLTVTKGSGIGGSSRIVLRGDATFSTTGSSPLFVVDGIPIDNRSTSGSIDFGTGVAEINSEDIESVSVLKGPAAAALYGSRAANGAIIITSKSGKGKKGLGIEVNNTTTFETVLRTPEFQNVYGQGYNGEFEYGDGNKGGTGINDHADESWGPRLDGRLLPQFDSPTANGFLGSDVRADRGAITPTPWVPSPYSIKDFYETGFTNNLNVAVTSVADKSNFRVSYTNLTQEGLLPNTDLKRNTISVNGKVDLTDKLKVSVNSSYVKTASDNRPIQDYTNEGLQYMFLWMGRQVNLNSLKNRYYQKGFEDEAQFNWNYAYNNNPYFLLYENTNGQEKDRVIGNITASYQFTPKLSLMLRTGIDNSNEIRTYRRAKSNTSHRNGNYWEEKLYFQERNSDFLANYDHMSDTNWDFSVAVGGNIRKTDARNSSVRTNGLLIPGYFNIQNTIDPIQGSTYVSEKLVYSLYSTAKVTFKNYLFLDLTARNDWSSTLPLNNNSYFYPSVALSGLISDMVTLPEWISFMKLRGAFAQVGNDTEPYQLRNSYLASSAWGSVVSNKTLSGSLKNVNLKPETATSYELGADVRFFNGRIGIDAAYYITKNVDQIIEVPVTNTTGYNSKFINAGEIQNKGLEVLLNTQPVKTTNFAWDFAVNFSKNTNEVIELADGVDNLVLGDNGYITVRAEPGKALGVYGQKFTRVMDESSPHYGKIIVDSSGEPKVNSGQEYFGSYAPDFQMGFSNKFNYKNFDFSFLFEWRQGGKIRSLTESIGWRAGNLIETLQGRENGYDMSDPANGLVFEGVIDNGDGTYRNNDIKITPQRYWRQIGYKSRAEGTMHDATFVKLREVKLAYKIPNKFAKKLALAEAKVALVGSNLLLFATDSQHFDPEAISGGGNMVPGVENLANPSSRSFGFNVNLKF